MKSYNGWDPVTFKEQNDPDTGAPGELYLPTDDIPLSIYLNEPDGTPLMADPANPDPYGEFDPGNLIDRLPVVHPGKLSPPIGWVSRGTSQWLDFNGIALRMRNAQGLAPPFFEGIHGTYNALQGTVPVGKDGQVIVGNPVPNVPGNTSAHYVANTGSIPFFDPGLCSGQGSASPPYNDLKVDAPEYSLQNALTDNAAVTLQFQGALPVRAGSHVPDPDTLTDWVVDLRELSGYPLVRFRVTFDLAVNATYPFGPDSKRPAVDWVRIRARY
jgi:hypothetical protein